MAKDKAQKRKEKRAAMAQAELQQRKVARTDQLNIGLMVLSLILAFQVPFALFLFAYAVLGPLHYLTEINWLGEKKWFVSDRSWVWLAVALACLVVLPEFFDEPLMNPTAMPEGANSLLGEVDAWANGYIFLALVLALGFVLIKQWKYRAVFFVIGLVLGVVLNEIPFYVLIVGALLPTLIHVYLFTLLFMLYGARKSRSRYGFASVVIGLLIPAIIIFWPLAAHHYLPSLYIRETFIDSSFYRANGAFVGALGITDGRVFDWTGEPFVRMQIFMAYAYTYHYLNWFSKTRVIGWHKGMSKSRLAAIVLVWVVLVAIYAWDYALGFVMALALSFLHVFLEFPLNVVTVRSAFQGWRKKSVSAS